MKIVVIGNICAGKSTLVNQIEKGYRIVKIDDLRKKFGNGSFSKEYYCWALFLEACEDKSDAILEFTGCGIHIYAIKEALSDKDVKIIFVKTPLSICQERAKNKDFEIPYPWKSDIFETIRLLDVELNSLIETGFWKVDLTLNGEEEFPKTKQIMEDLGC